MKLTGYTETNMSALLIIINNIHCEQCEKSLRRILSQYFCFKDGSEITDDETAVAGHNSQYLLKLPKLVHFPSKKLLPANSLDIVRSNGMVTIKFSDDNFYGGVDTHSDSSSKQEPVDSSLKSSIVKSLENAGFEVEDIYMSEDLESGSSLGHNSMHGSTLHTVWDKLYNKKERQYQRHQEHCALCRSQAQHGEKNDQEKNVRIVVPQDSIKYRAVFTVAGMTCTACANAVEDAIKKVINSKHGSENNYCAVNSVTNTAVATVTSKQHVQRIIDSIKESGYSARLVEILPLSTEVRFKVVAAIGGITCAACASSITNAVQDLSFVDDVAINVVSKTGIFILTSDDQNDLHNLKDAVEDCGFDFEMMGLPTKVDHLAVKKPTRTVNLRVDGMFCPHCPERVNEALNRFGEAELVVNDPISLRSPFIKFTYIPNVEKGVTIRTIIAEILKEVSSGNDSNINVSIVEEITLDEHLRKMAKRETKKIVTRLFVATIFAIPTFIFGVVGMALLPKRDRFRKWLDEPLWYGKASRDTWILFILSTPVYFFVADIFHRKAFKEIRVLWKQKNNWKRRLFRFGSMNLLMSLGTSVAYFASIALLAISAVTKRHHDDMGFTTTYFDSVVFLTFFLLIGRLLESFSKSKTAEAISKLGSLKQHNAILVEKADGNLFVNDRVVDLKHLELGDYIKISPGQSPPVDCIIVQGESQFDESALTGESVPITHVQGEQVFSGTVNVGGNTVIGKLSTLDGESLLDQIVNTVRYGQLKRAPIERLADILTGYFVPVITLLAIVTWIIWLSLGFSGALPQRYLDTDVGGWAVWSLGFAISVFVVACPCGIGLAAPTALFVGSGLAAKNGILTRGGGAAFQEGSRVSVVCFDKTGTLTKGGAPKITNYTLHPNPKIKKIALQVTRDLESNSKHPLTIAVKNFIDDNFSQLLGTIKVPQVEEVPGRGLKGEVLLEEHTVDPIWDELRPTSIILGNERFISENNCHLNSEQLKNLTCWKTQGKSIIIVAIKCENYFKSDRFFPVFFMAARDELRPEAKGVIKLLQKEGIECWMISGDNVLTAKAIAKELNIDNVVAEVLPEEKAEKVKWIQQTHIVNNSPAVVAMVGDGINDAPALGAADIGVALASGSDLAMTSCDFVLLSPTNTLSSLLTLFQLSRKVFRRVRFNFGWALIYNMVCIPIAAGVIYPYNNSRLSPVWASAAMAASSVSVVLSSLALRFFKPSTVAKDEAENIQFENIPVIEEKFV